MNYEHYKRLYKRFLNRNPEELLDLAGSAGLYPREPVLDLCAGGGRLSVAALKYGAHEVIAVDQDREMMENIPPEIKRIEYDVPTALDELGDSSIDMAFCQQGVNYWFDSAAIEDLYRVLMPGGVFVFNTFNSCPRSLYSHSYMLDGDRYMEISWLVEEPVYGIMVHHVQVLDGHCSDTNRFRWVPPEEFRRVLEPFFDIKRIDKGKTSLYRCQSRKDS